MQTVSLLVPLATDLIIDINSPISTSNIRPMILSFSCKDIIMGFSVYYGVFLIRDAVAPRLFYA